MVDLIAQVAVETLHDLLIEEARLLSGVSGQRNEIERELTYIHCFLKDADARPDRYDSQIVCKLVSELKDLASIAEDVIEKYDIEVISKRRRGRESLKQKLERYACILSEWLSVHQTGTEIKSIRARMAKLTEELKSMPSSSIDHAQQQQQQQHLLRQTFAHELEENFVGMEKDIDHLVTRVKDDDHRSNRVISICGMGGLGKTTLARKIYNHNDVQSRFDSRAWICISQQFQQDKALQDILKQILREEGMSATSMDFNELVNKLYDVLKQKKCFIVIDDIWKEEHWNILRKAFPIAEGNCKVLLTTRNEKLVSEEHVYKLDYLTEDQGWDLLQKIALSNVHSQELKPELTQLEAIGREIVEKCGRLPLAISVIGGNLCGKQTLSEWKKVSDNLDTYLKYGEGASGEDERVKQVLDLSYNVLPYYLKPCFLYLGCFREDEEIDTENLYLLWMAEGLISSKDRGSNETLRDIAHRYLSELALRCMVQVRSEDINRYKFSSTYNNFISCRLHDLMRDLCLSKGQEEGFIKVMQFSEGTHNSIPFSLGTIRRLAILSDHLPEDKLVETTENLKRLRSLLLLSEYKFEGSLAINSELFVANLKKMKFLRILILVYCNFEDEKLPSEVGKLMHLRYLSLFGSRVKELPMSIRELPNLHTLDLRVWDDITLELPNVIYKMKRLRHLFLENWSVSGDEMLILDGLKELETLVLGYIKKDPIRIVDLPKLTNLRLLQGYFSRDVESIVDHMDQLREVDVIFSDYDFSSSSLLKKIFMCDSFIRLRIYCPIGSNFPCYQPGMSTNLVDLILSKSMIEGDGFKVLGKFPMLKSLILNGDAFVGTEMICRATDFPQLRYLSLWDLHNLEKWEVEHGAMPNLSKIEIFHCDKLKMIPEGLAFITTLQQLLIRHMPREFKERIRGVNGEPGPDYHKVSHIPVISIDY